jgi:geranylgeranyl reductase family protein
MTASTLQPEILVIGAGPGGSTAAWALAQTGHDVLLIDGAEFPRDKTCGDGLTPMAVRTLRQIGVLPQVEAAGAARIDRVFISGPLGISATMPFADHQPGASYALVLPRFELDEILRQHAIRGGAKYLGKVRVERIDRQNDHIVAVRGDSPSGVVEIKARQVVIAVGANMGLLKREGFITHKPRFIRAARAYYDNVVTEANRYDFYFDLELLPGYGWVFPTGDGRANIGVGILPVFWSTRKPAAVLLEEFVARRSKDGILNGARRVGSVKGYPLRIDYPAQRTAGANWVIVGEAAGLVNPVTGEGIDLAMESGLIAAQTLHEDIHAGRPNHLAYQRELWERFGPMFSGLRILRDILITPFFTDYALWLMRQHAFLTRTVMSIAQGFWPPQEVFHPLFILQFFMPVSPRLFAEGISQLFKGGRRGSRVVGSE